MRLRFTSLGTVSPLQLNLAAGALRAFDLKPQEQQVPTGLAQTNQ